MDVAIGGVPVPVALITAVVAVLLFVLGALGRAIDKNGPRQTVAAIKSAQDVLDRLQDDDQKALIQGAMDKEFRRLEFRNTLFSRWVRPVLEVLASIMLAVVVTTIAVNLSPDDPGNFTNVGGDVVVGVLGVLLALATAALGERGRTPKSLWRSMRRRFKRDD